MLLLNKDSLELDLFEYVDESFGSLPVQEFKYKRWDWAWETVPSSVADLMTLIFDRIPKDDDMRWLVDYKVRDLKAGDCGCTLEGWHLDVTENPNHKSKPDVHLIYSTEIGTDFLTQPMYVSPSHTHFSQVIAPFNLNTLESKVVQAKPNTVSMYNRFQMHRGPRILKDCRRMLLRITATEVIR